MADHLFDRLSRALALRLDRRAALRASGAGAATSVAALLTGSAAAQQATPVDAETATTDPAFLFVQTAQGGTFTPAESDGEASHRLTLQGHHGGTIYFSDRPDRIFGDAPTQQFLDGLGFTPANPPNAALVTAGADGDDDVVILELTDPTFDPDTAELSYGATILGEFHGADLTPVNADEIDTTLPEEFGRASLFIDDCADITACGYMSALPHPVVVGPIPGGPYGSCWHWTSLSCQPCNHSQSSLNDLCTQAYSECRQNQCFAF